MSLQTTLSTSSGNLVETQVVFDLKLIGMGKGTAFMESYGSLQLTQFYQIMNDLLLNHPWIFTILMYVKTLAMDYVPVRTGHLLDYILTTMKLQGGKGLSNSKVYHWEFSFDIPLDRPLIIPGRVQHSREFGYGDWGTVKLLNVIPNVTVIYVTGMGHALYLLNDPKATRNYATRLLALAEELIQDTLDTMVFEITLKLAEKWGLGKLERKVKA